MSQNAYTKGELGRICGVSKTTVSRWCNVDYFSELTALGYRKFQKAFTPKQWAYLVGELIEPEKAISVK